MSLEAPRVVYDLGCGAGEATTLIAARWPAAKVVGIDNSPAMLARARELDLAADFMDTGAACRTFNVLLAEDRRAAAALIAVP